MDTDREARRKMQFLLALKSNRVSDPVLKAMEKVDREEFVTPDVVTRTLGVFTPEESKELRRDRAYEDTPLRIGCDQTISQPSVVGIMTQALRVENRHKVLEVGTGSGYQAAILGQLARRVYTVERHRPLAQGAASLFERLGYSNITVIATDGCLGLPEQAPFDRILVSAAAEDPPPPLLDQLRIGGIMVLPVGQSDAVQSLIRVTRTETGYEYDELLSVRFVPLIEGMARD